MREKLHLRRKILSFSVTFPLPKRYNKQRGKKERLFAVKTDARRLFKRKTKGASSPLRQKPTEKERNKDGKRMLRITEN